MARRKRQSKQLDQSARHVSAAAAPTATPPTIERPTAPPFVPVGAPLADDPAQAQTLAPDAGLGWMAPLAIVSLAVLTALTYSNAAHDALVVDDASFPPRPDQVTPASLLQLFREDVWASARVVSGVYRPLAMALLQLQSLLWEDYLPGYHLTVVAAHLGVTLMVFFLARALLAHLQPGDEGSTQPRLWAAWLAALAFGVHPIHTEAVNSIFNGAEVLATLGVVSALWLVATQQRRAPLLTWSAVSAVYLASLLCKESAVTLPVLAGLVLLAAAPHPGEQRWRRLQPLAWLLIPLGVAIALRYSAIGLGGVTATQSVSSAHAAGIDWTDRLQLLATSLRDFSRMIVWPHPLRASYDDYTATGLGNALFVLGVILATAIWLWRRAPVVSIGIAFFFIALLPSSRLLSHLGVVVTLAERYVYLPSVGAGLAFGGLLDLAARHWRALPWLVGLPACFLLAYVTFERNSKWRSDVVLWEAEVAAAPANPDGWKWLTAAYLNARRTADAGAVCDRELTRHPSAIGFHLNCGAAYIALGQRKRAESAFRTALASGGGATAHLQLARLLVAAGRSAEADAEYDAAAALEADAVRQHTIRGERLRRLHPDQIAEAKAAYDAALAIDPRYEPAQAGLRSVQQMGGVQQ